MQTEAVICFVCDLEKELMELPSFFSKAIYLHFDLILVIHSSFQENLVEETRKWVINVDCTFLHNLK